MRGGLRVTTRSLDTARIDAARASAGRSDEAMRTKVLDVLAGAGATGDVLDFGAGTGAVAAALVRSGRYRRVLAADLVDYGERPADVQWIQADLNERLPLADESIDAVVAVEVIEHLENPRFVAREWYRTIRPGGILVLTTPNNESWRSLLALAMEGHFAAFRGSSYPGHLTALLREDLRRVLAEAGFAQPEFFFSDIGALPRLTGLTWQRLSAGRLRGLRYSDNLGCAVRKPDPGPVPDRIAH